MFRIWTEASDERFLLDPPGLPLPIRLRCLHEILGDTDREVGILEEDRTVSFPVEIGLVAAFFNQDVRFLLFLPLALYELHDIRMPDLERLHLCCPPRLAARLDNCGDLVVDPHEREWTGRTAAAGEFFPFRPDGG